MDYVFRKWLRIPASALILLALFIAAAITLYLFLDSTDPKTLTLTGGIYTGIVVYIIGFIISIYQYFSIDRFRELGVREILSDRRGKEYYGKLICSAKEIIVVTGTSCSRFIDDFANENNNTHILIDLLRKKKNIRVQFMMPLDEYMDEKSKNNFKNEEQKLKTLLKNFPDNVEVRRFAFQAKYSLVRVDGELIVGPVFADTESKDSPAIHLDVYSSYAEKYLNDFAKGLENKPTIFMKIFIKPRVHISLISMHATGYRINGGIGFSLNEPQGVLTFSKSSCFQFKDNRKSPLSGDEKLHLQTVIEDAKQSFGFKDSLTVNIEGELLTHYGMGSGTAIRLACLEALCLLNDRYTDEENLIALSKRGGTSGIGVNTYFNGQFVFDLGRSNKNTEFLPSSQAKSTTPIFPLVLDRINMPDWKVGICIPTDIPIKTQKDELEFFERTCPISENESYKALYHSLFGVYASLKEQDKSSFCKAVKEIQKCEWKKKEREEYGQKLFVLEQKLYDLGALCVGMSSLGPMLFFMMDDENFRTIKQSMSKEACDIIITSPSNSGRKIVPERIVQ